MAPCHSDKIAEEGGPAERGLAEAKDRAAMISAERVWRDLGPER